MLKQGHHIINHKGYIIVNSHINGIGQSVDLQKIGIAVACSVDAIVEL